MVSPNYYLCDICGAKTTLRQFVATAREMGPAGSSDTTGETLDLCGTHWMELVSKAAKHDLEVGAKLAALVKQIANSRSDYAKQLDAQLQKDQF